ILYFYKFFSFSYNYYYEGPSKVFKTKIIYSFIIFSLTLLVGCKQIDKSGVNQTIKYSQAQNPSQNKVFFVLGQTTHDKNLPAIKIGNRTIYYYPKMALNLSEVSQIILGRTHEGKNILSFKLSKKGTEKLSVLTEKNIGKLLLLISNNQIINITKIGKKSTTGTLKIQVNSGKTASSNFAPY